MREVDAEMVVCTVMNQFSLAAMNSLGLWEGLWEG